MSNAGEITITPIVIRGKVNYCKFLGDPRPDYDKTGLEWTSDLYEIEDIDNVMSRLKKLGVKKTLKEKDTYLNGSPYLTLKQKATRANGKPNDPVRIVDAKGKPWPEDVDIGNGSTVDVKCEVWDFGPKRFKGFYPKAMRVLEHVPYVKKEDDFAPLSDDDDFFPGDDTPWDDFEDDTL